MSTGKHNQTFLPILTYSTYKKIYTICEDLIEIKMKNNLKLARLNIKINKPNPYFKML